jgi:hypothetical protein
MNTNYTKGLTKKQVKDLEKNIKDTKKAYEEGNIKKAQAIADKRPKTDAKEVNSKFTTELKKIYNVDTIPKAPSKQFQELTGLSVKDQKTIIDRGKAAYLTAGSRPNQNTFSWSQARLYAFVVKANKNKNKDKINQDNDIFIKTKGKLKY